MPKIGGKPDRNQELYDRLMKVDAGAKRDVSDKDAEFIDSVMKRWKKTGPFEFSDPQAEWIADLEERYL